MAEREQLSMGEALGSNPSGKTKTQKRNSDAIHQEMGKAGVRYAGGQHLGPRHRSAGSGCAL